MKYRKISVLYIPRLRNYNRNVLVKKTSFLNINSLIKSNALTLSNRHSKNTYTRNKYTNHHKHYYTLSKKSKSIFPLFIGLILIFIGVVSILKNTVVYTPIRLMNSTGGGISFATTSILILFGVGIIFFNKRYALSGFAFIILGILVITISIFFSLKMGLLPTSLFKTLLIFGSIISGSALILKWIKNKLK